MVSGSQSCARVPVAQGQWTYQTVFRGPWVQPSGLGQVFKTRRHILVSLRLFLSFCFLLMCYTWCGVLT